MSRLVCLALMLLTAGLWAVEEETQEILILNSPNAPDTLPRHFRIIDGHYQVKALLPPRQVGLAELHASGSAQFSERGFAALRKELRERGKLYVVDLRQESHGFINGAAVSWYVPRDWANKGKTLEEITADEKLRLLAIKRLRVAEIFRIEEKNPNGTIADMIHYSVPVNEVSVEPVVVEAAAAGYLRLPVADHTRPDKEQVNRFVAFVSALPADAWVHFHCSAGEGRTTTFLTMYDMMRNAKEVSFEEILQRQYLSGGTNLLTLPSQTDWKYPLAVERFHFLEAFYDYCRSNNDNFKTPF